MLEIDIPAYKTLRLEHVVFDYNGTLAVDGTPLPGVAGAVQTLAELVRVHVVTADTHGKAREYLEEWPCELTILSGAPGAAQDLAKLEYVRRLGAEVTACVGNGRNDRRMLEAAALGIAVLEKEGLAVEALQAADVVCNSILEALDLLLRPKRLVATLRS